MFRYRRLGYVAMAEINGTIPILSKKENSEGGDNTARERIFCEKVFINCVIYPRICACGVDDPDAISFDLILASDVNWLLPRIMATTGLQDQKADEARTFPNA